MALKTTIPTPVLNRNVGDLIRLQREAMQMSVAQLATRIGVNRNTITNYETGRTEPTASDLVRLSTALGCVINDLLSGGNAPPPPRFAFRAHAPLRKDPEIAVAARKYLRAYDEIEEITDSRLPNKLRNFSRHHKGALSDEYIEMVAETLRSTSGLHDAGPENIVSVLEGLGVRTLFFEHDSNGLEGLSTIQGDIKLIMLRNRRKERKLIERTIFSAAHELGHLVLHPQLFTSEEPDEDHDARRYEKEADKFAGRFLVPTEELVRVWEEEGLGELRLFDALILLKQVFHVSFWCLFHRVIEAKLHQDVDMAHFIVEVKRRLRITGPATKEQLEPDQLAPEVLYTTNRFGRLVRSAFLRELIGESKVAEMFQVPVDRAKEITSDWLRPQYALVDDGDL